MYRVTKRFSGGAETPQKNFPKRELAEAFIQEELAKDVFYKVKTTYTLYDDLDEVLKAYTEADLIKKTESSSGRSSGQSQSFSPTPFNMKPQPGGLPHTWLKDEDKDKDKK